MRVTRPSTLDDALTALASDPEATPLAGGTDLMVDLNFGRARPAHLVTIRRLPELRRCEIGADGSICCGCGLPYANLQQRPLDPAFLQAVRTVGSPQIRSLGTLGGNLGTCSPAGDLLPVLAALDATLVVRSAGHERRLRFDDWMQGPKRPALAPGELVVSARWRRAGAAQAFLKAGVRNAMVIAIANLALVADRRRRRVRVAMGCVGPRILRAPAAERFAEGLFCESGWERPLSPTPAAAARFGELCALATTPIDDVRGSACYRRHVTALMGRRALARVGAVV